MVATSASWKIDPFVPGAALPSRAEFSVAEFAALREGLVPGESDDKWFIYFDPPYLYVHRSWTGQGVYRATLQSTAAGARLTEAHLGAEVPTADPALIRFHSRMLEWLMYNRLLGQERPVPSTYDP